MFLFIIWDDYTKIGWLYKLIFGKDDLYYVCKLYTTWINWDRNFRENIFWASCNWKSNSLNEERICKYIIL